MGFTPTAGLVMGTRSGDLDPSVPPYLIRNGLDPGEVGDALDQDSGLRALAGASDVREILAAADTGDDDAALALEVWAHRARAMVAGMVSALGGVDVLAFSGGVAEHQPRMRALLVDGLGFLGLALDADRNAAATDDDAVISGPSASAVTVVVEAREDVVIAEQVRNLLAE
jgi:acetate kinase